MPTPTTGFHYALADANGAFLAGSEVRLTPAPSDVEYPTDFHGSTTSTAEGNTITQQPLKDSRMRHWTWKGYPTYNNNFRLLWGQLIALRAKTRFAAGLSPYVYLIDCESGSFLRRTDVSYAVASATSTTVTLTGAALATNIARVGTIEITVGTGIGQLKAINSNTSNVITINGTFAVTPGVGATARLRYEYPEWLKVRVIDVTRKLAANRGTVAFEDARISFLIDDSNYNAF